MLAYLSRYTHRVAIANSRLIAFDEDSITVKWKDYRIEGRDRYTRMTLATLSAGGPAVRDREMAAAELRKGAPKQEREAEARRAADEKYRPTGVNAEKPKLSLRKVTP